MPLEKHLVTHLQEMYVLERDFQTFVRAHSGQARDRQLRALLDDEAREIDGQLEGLRRCLESFNLQPREDQQSPFVQALRQEEQMTMQAMPNMTRADMDVHLAITDLSFGQMEIGLYQGMVNMAYALGRSEVIDVLERNLSHENEDVQQMQQLLPTLIRESRAMQA